MLISLALMINLKNLKRSIKKSRFFKLAYSYTLRDSLGIYIYSEYIYLSYSIK